MKKNKVQENAGELFEQFVTFLKENKITVDVFKNDYESFQTCLFKGMGIKRYGL